jgi:hypothetical protein
METMTTIPDDPAAERLASEVSDVQASITLVATGIATRITLTSLRFGREVAEHLQAAAAGQGVVLEASFRPDEHACDVSVTRAARTTHA